MGRQIVKTQAIVLRSRRMGETSKLVTLYSDAYGKLKVVANGARRPKSKFGAALEVMTEGHAVCYLRDDRDLHTLAECDVVRGFSVLLRDYKRMSFGSAACELVDRMTIEHESNPRLYKCLVGVLVGLEEVDDEQIESLFWYFQLRIADALGYRPELGGCVVCSAILAECERPHFSAVLGGVLCVNCYRDQVNSEGMGYRTYDRIDDQFSSGGNNVAKDSLGFLALLQKIRSYKKEVIPRKPEKYQEIRAMLSMFFEYHGGLRGRLKALEHLE